MTLREFQQKIDETYGARDGARGGHGTFLWFVEEVGELAEAIRRGSGEEKRAEFADVMAWLVSLASLEGIDIEDAVTAKYGDGCPACREKPCRCEDPTKSSADA
jgi:NTP pyrophosphatase (non-canonical NTP hydrolase)